MHHLAWVLLGLRTTPKEVLNISYAEMVYGQPLVVHGSFFPESSDTNASTETELQTVYIRQDFVKPVLSSPYTCRGPYRILERSDTAYMLNKNEKQEWVSLYHLNPAYCDVNPKQISRQFKLAHILDI